MIIPALSVLAIGVAIMKAIRKRKKAKEEIYPCVEETKNFWITKTQLSQITPKEKVQRWRLVKNDGHRLLFAIIDNKPQLWAIYHPKSEPLDYILGKYGEKCLVYPLKF